MLANSLDLDSTRRRARPAPDLGLPKSLKDTVKRAIGTLIPSGQARKPKDAGSVPEAKQRMTLAACQPPVCAASDTQVAHVAIWTVVEMWLQFDQTTSPPSGRPHRAPFRLRTSRQNFARRGAGSSAIGR